MGLKSLKQILHESFLRDETTSTGNPGFPVTIFVKNPQPFLEDSLSDP